MRWLVFLINFLLVLMFGWILKQLIDDCNGVVPRKLRSGVLLRLSIQKSSSTTFFLVGFFWLFTWMCLGFQVFFWWWEFLGSFFFSCFWMFLFCLWLCKFWIGVEAKLKLFAFSFLFKEERFCVLYLLILFIVLMLPLSWCIYSF
jgi:hypothetical protein